MGQLYDPHYAAVAQFERALAAVEAGGLPMSASSAMPAHHVDCELELERVPTASAQEAIEHTVLGMALYEPVIAAMRRLAHQHLAAQRFGQR